MGYGKKAARNIDKRLMGAEALPEPGPRVRVRDGAARDAERERPPRARRDARRRAGAVVRRGLARPHARRRASRRRPAACAATSAAPRDREDRLDREGEGPHRRRGDRGHRRPDDPRGRAGQQQVHPRPLLHGGPQRGRRLPAVHGRGLRRRAACCPPARPRCRRAWRSPPARRSSQSYRKIALELLFAERNHVCAVCVSSGPLRAADAGPGARRHARPLPVQLPAAPGRHHAPALRARPQPLHPVLALRADLRRDRGRPRVGHRRPRHRVAARLASCSGPGARRRPARAAASACRPARPARWPRRAGASRR